MPVTSGTFDLFLLTKEGVSARCFVMLDKSFGFLFIHVFEALEAVASNFKCFGGQPDCKAPVFLCCLRFCGSTSGRNHERRV